MEAHKLGDGHLRCSCFFVKLLLGSSQQLALSASPSSLVICRMLRHILVWHPQVLSSPVLQPYLLNRVSCRQPVLTQVLILAALGEQLLGNLQETLLLGLPVEFHTSLSLTQTLLRVLFHTAPRCGASSCCSAPRELPCQQDSEQPPLQVLTRAAARRVATPNAS